VCLKPEDLRCGIGSLEAKMRISDAVQGFLFTIAGNGYSEATICNYRHSLTHFALHLGEKQVADFTTTEIRNFLSYVRATTYTKPSRQYRLFSPVQPVF
jgi:site-specific recombinase XerD